MSRDVLTAIVSGFPAALTLSPSVGVGWIAVNPDGPLAYPWEISIVQILNLQWGIPEWLVWDIVRQWLNSQWGWAVYGYRPGSTGSLKRAGVSKPAFALKVSEKVSINAGEPWPCLVSMIGSWKEAWGRSNGPCPCSECFLSFEWLECLFNNHDPEDCLNMRGVSSRETGLTYVVLVSMCIRGTTVCMIRNELSRNSEKMLCLQIFFDRG